MKRTDTERLEWLNALHHRVEDMFAEMVGSDGTEHLRDMIDAQMEWDPLPATLGGPDS